LFLKRLGLVFFGTALGLLAGEIALRAIGFREEVARRSTVFDPRYGTVREDSWVFRFHADAASDPIDVRGQLVPRAKAPGETRVLFIGDSGTEGVRMGIEDTFPARFEARMGGGFRAINAGVFGMTTIDELRFLSERLLPLEPDVVVVGLFMANDINFNLGHVSRLREVTPRSGSLHALTDRSALAQFLFFRAIALNARYRWVATDELAEESVLPREIGLVDQNGLHALSYPMGEIATYVQPESAMIARAYDVLEGALWQMRQLGDRRGFELRVLLIPTPSAVSGRLTVLHYPTILEDLRAEGIAIDEASLDLDAPARRVLRICEDLAIRCYDPTARMREIGPEVFFPDDEHPTATGHAVLAETLAEEW
jgi:lysophospholipase L1-like esterase